MNAHERALKAHQEGFAANAFGLLYCDNPYKDPGIERTAWFAGWQSANENT